MTTKIFSAIFGGERWKWLIAVTVALLVPVIKTIASDLIWLDTHHAEEPALIEQARGDHYEIIQLKQSIQTLVNSQQQLVYEIRQEREERLRERR